MKPPEILSMIEEAAGTRMFETKKINAQKTIEKKQQKVIEITNVIANEITPQLEKLKDDQKLYHQYMRNTSELEKIQKILIAYHYIIENEKIKDAENTKNMLIESLQEFESQKTMKSQSIQEIISKITDIEKSPDNSAENQLKELRQVDAKLSIEVVQCDMKSKHHNDNIQQETERLASLQLQRHGNELLCKEKVKELQVLNSNIELKQVEVNTAEQASALLREKYENALAGDVDESNANMLSLPEQIATWERVAREADSKLKQCQIQKKHLKTTIDADRIQKNKQESSQKKLQGEYEKIQSEVYAIENQFQSLHYEEAEEQKIRDKKNKVYSQLQIIRDKCSILSAQLEAKLKFEFKDPERGFDRNRIKGLIARLLKVKDPLNAIALEVTAGGKLHHVVVDTDETSKLILQRGQLRHRTTFCPLNKITCQVISTSRVGMAKELAKKKGANANLALELVDFDENVRKAMEYAFGNTIICDRPDVANTITYSPQISTRCVTLDGDSYSTNGTLSGGSKGHLGDLLGKLSELSMLQTQLTALELEYQELQNQLKRMEALSASAGLLQSELRQKKTLFLACEKKLAESDYAQMETEIAEKERQLEVIKEVLNDIIGDMKHFLNIYLGRNYFKSFFRGFEVEVE